MKSANPISLTRVAALGLVACASLHAQTSSPFVEQFNSTRSDNSWYFYDGACLTAGSAVAVLNPGPLPGCGSILASYYGSQKTSPNGQENGDPALVGGDDGYLGGTSLPGNWFLQKPDEAGSGALRFTNGYPYGMFESGAILSARTYPSSGGLQITFKTVTYRGTTVGYSGKGSLNTGADGISFFLTDGATDLRKYPGVGANGGSLGYSCSNINFDTLTRAPGTVRGYDGLTGAYLGVGVDEFGNFLDGTLDTFGTSNLTNGGDNTASGGGYLPNTIGLRGAGSVAWAPLTTAYGNNPYSSSLPYYPAALGTQCPAGHGSYDAARGYCAQCSVGAYNPVTAACGGGGVLTKNPTYAQLAVTNTCATGTLYNYSNPAAPTSAGPTSLANPANTAGILDYTAIAGTSLSSLGGAYPISSINAQTRAQATAITYNLKITQNQLLSFSFSYNGGSYQPVITDRDLTSSIGPVPGAVRFGFAGSTGGSTNIHEIVCFKAEPISSASGGAGVNTYENPVINPGTQLFLGYYAPQDSTGRVTAQTVAYNAASGTVSINSTPNWDASCVLTGVSVATGACSTGITRLAAEAPASRTMLTWNGTQGVAFQWNSLNPAQQAALNAGDAAGGNRLAFLRGDRSNEISPLGVGLFRTRASVLGDVIHSSPTWVGPPQTYAASVAWSDRLYPAATAPESRGQSYAAFQTQQQSRLNVVYVGANDGFLHGFRAGSLDANGALLNTAATPNDGYEVLAYMPGALLQSAPWSSTSSPTQSLAQNIHGVVPPSAGVDAYLDFSGPHYGHNYFVDAPPATGDVFWGGQWHTWLVGGLGAGGAVIYALDITNPTAFSDRGQAPAQTVIGEWTAGNLNCANVGGCGAYLGNTYGTPIIRRFHNGSWGVIFGNGYGTPGSAAGIFIMLIDPVSGAPTFYYLAVPATAGAANGIASPAAADLDLDHIVDYVYAGDLLGNVWRFDLTSQNPRSWAVSGSSPLFNAGQPITTAPVVGTRKTVVTDATYAGLTFSAAPVRVVVNFGTGRQIPQTATSNTEYATGTQALYGVWDWDMTAWNKLSPAQQAVSLAGPRTLTSAKLQQQTITTLTSTSPATRTVSTNAICWAESCGAGQQGQFGWVLPLPGTSGDTLLVNGQALPVSEQIIFNPQINTDGELVVNTFIPALDTALICDPAPATGFTLGIEPDTGEQSSTAYFSVNGTAVSAVQNNGTGIPLEVTSGAGQNAEYLLTQTTSGQAAAPTLINRHVIIAGQRLGWVQRR